MSEQISEQEKKAIHSMKRLLLYSKEHEYFSPFLEHEIDDMEILLNLLDKQQEEIEKLKFNNHMVGKWNEYLDKDCISKNRIKEIIKKYIDIEEALNYTNQEIYGEDLKNMILELLGEN